MVNIKNIHFLTLFSVFGFITADIICQDEGICRDDETCCLLSSNIFGCCPYPKSTCCSDGKYCCPYDYTCDLKEHQCFRGSHKRDMLEKHPAKRIHGNARNPFSVNIFQNLELMNLGNVLCPDRCSTCPDTYTCCLLLSGEYGCCPYSNAVCCNDYSHCCPYNYVCNIPNCVPNQRFEYKDLTKTAPYIKKENLLSYFDQKPVFCKDTSVCAEGSTCCLKPDGNYACCPYPNADCCSDGIHCCPSGFLCSIETKNCVKENKILPMLQKQKAKLIPPNKKKIFNSEIENILCPGDLYFCPTSERCCLIKQDVYGCCPQSAIVSCEDNTFYCPEDTKCDMKKFKCITNNGSFTNLLQKKLASLVKNAVAERQNLPILCPDNIHFCDSVSSCCLLKNGEYGCCPISSSVVCDDNIHCCPPGSECNIGGCLNVENKITTSLKITISKLRTICPGGSTCCPNSYTCCLLESEEYGCCPLPQATCCSDRMHCCPYGYLCDGSGTCSNGAESIKALKKLKSFHLTKEIILKVSDVHCPDGVSLCPDGNTCCKLNTGEYSCCPLLNAVCCADQESCCPHGYSCVSGGFCARGNERVKGLVHTSAILKVKNVDCPDGVSQCSDGSTCCKIGSDQYGCCPLENAVCCADHKHCCPHGYSCSSRGFCTRGNERVKGLVHTSAILKVKNVDCPDHVSQCPDGSTCCKMLPDQYGCCPLENAVCCDDLKHCCPHGYSCSSGGVCYRKEKKEPAIKLRNARTDKKTLGHSDGFNTNKKDEGDYVFY